MRKKERNLLALVYSYRYISLYHYLLIIYPEGASTPIYSTKLGNSAKSLARLHSPVFSPPHI